MLTYVVKRLLIMIPTFLGISLMIWAVMTLSPGEPAGSGSQKGFGEDATEDLENRERENQSARMFREQFALNRPRFWNDWTGLEANEVKAEIVVLRDGVQVHGSGRVKQATRRLEDWGDYAVPVLVGLLESTADDPELQTGVLRYLKLSAYQFKTIYEKGAQPTEEEIEEDREKDEENRRLASSLLNWKPGATRSERAAVVENWKKWYAEREEKGRWSYRDDGWERAWIAVSDTQFGRYWGNLATGDFGLSSRTKENVLGIILSKLKYSLSLAVPSFLIAWVLAVFTGVTSAAKHNSWLDQSSAVVLFMLYSIPSFLMATVVQRLFAVELEWFPISQFEDPEARAWNTWDHFGNVLWHLVLPLFCYTYGSLAYISRQARSGMLEVMKSDYIRTARAKGMKESVVLWKHAVRNGMMPLITLLGTALPILLAGSVVIEYIFQIPGFGDLMINAIFQKDYNVVMGVSLISAMLTLVGLLIADLLYAAVDPRVSLE
ncbi:MAG: ABC transporter permease [Planctomycetota bacterium]|nr:ABC transporter permease [Planctomycetota bacterium]